MSEYQYYEFQSIDKALSEKAQRSISKLSSRSKVSPYAASFVYNYGDFPADPIDILAKYFDAFFYVSNWGRTQLAFKFPKELLSIKAIEQYCDNEQVTLSEFKDFVILDINLHEEEGYHDWLEGENWLYSLVSLRDNILKEDYRVLYLAWLKYHSDCSYDKDINIEEPSVPTGLKELSPALNDFIEIFRLNKDLVKSAAKMSVQVSPPIDLTQEIKKLSREDCDYFLEQILEGKPNIGSVLRKRLSAFLPVSSKIAKQAARTLNQLLDSANDIKLQEKQKEVIQAEKQRVEELKELSFRQEQVWQHIDNLIKQAKSKYYAEAVVLLTQLKNLAIFEGKEYLEYATKMYSL